MCSHRESGIVQALGMLTPKLLAPGIKHPWRSTTNLKSIAEKKGNNWELIPGFSQPWIAGANPQRPL